MNDGVNAALNKDEVSEAAIRVEEERIRNSPEEIVDALWHWHDRESGNEEALGLALREVALKRVPDHVDNYGLSRVLDKAIREKAEAVCQSPDYLRALYGGL